MALGGRAAEDLIFNRVTNGAADDLRKVTAMANAQVSDVITAITNHVTND